jgi:hypothetical protein
VDNFGEGGGRSLFGKGVGVSTEVDGFLVNIRAA